MIKEITLNNYKCFNKEIFQLSDINLFFGLNGRGKSSVLQTVLLMSQSVNKSNSLKELFISSNFLKLGEFDDIRNSNLNNNSIKFEFKTDVDKMDSFGFEYVKNPNFPEKGLLNEFELNGQKSSEELISDSEITESKNKSINYKDDSRILNIFKNVHYVSADRIGPRLYVDKFGVENLEKSDSRGLNSINILSSNNDFLNENLFIGDIVPRNLTELCQMWLSYIFDGANIEVNNKGENVLALKINPQNDGKLYKSVNVGFGYSYILSIVLTCLLAKENDIVIFENPEAHLHPKAQSRLTHLFARLPQNKVQLFIESHSEHILNGLRVSIADKNCTINERSICTYFFGENFKIEKLIIDNKSFISNWPKDFFDQTDIDNSLIFKHSRI
jgi:predicted ATPase